MHIRFYLDFCPGLLAALTIQRIVVLPTAFRTVIVVCAPVAVLEPDIGHIIRNAEARDYVLVCIVRLHLSGIMLRMLYFQMLIQRTFRPKNKQKQLNSCQAILTTQNRWLRNMLEQLEIKKVVWMVLNGNCLPI